MSNVLDDAIHKQLTKSGTSTQGVIGTRCYPAGGAPQKIDVKDGQYLTWQLISNPQNHHQGGNAQLSSARIQFNCYGKTPKLAKALRNAIKSDIDNFRGNFGDLGSLITVRNAYFDTERMASNPPQDASQRGPQFRIVEFVISFVE